MAEKRLTAIKSIRAFCMHCCSDDMEYIRECPSGPTSSVPCPLHPYRMGKNPNITAETRAKLAERAKEGNYTPPTKNNRRKAS